jgi:beta-phosphoglucomutase-like phosphatase (HAD superfamily)
MEALRRIGVAPFEAIALEDSEHGAAAARAAGMYVVAVPNRVTACLAFEDVDAKLDTLESLSLSYLIEMATSQAQD